MKSILLPILSVLFLVIAFSCDDFSGTSGSTTPTTPTELPAPTSTVPSTTSLESQGKSLDVDPFNLKIIAAEEAKEDWANSPIEVALKFSGTTMDSRKKKIELEAPSGENFEELTVTITDDGLLDDSVQGEMVILRMEKKAGLWQILKATQLWKCYEGRGHQDYGKVPCN